MQSQAKDLQRGGTPATGQQRKVLSFELDSQTYGIDIGHVQEVRLYEAPTRLPNMPPWYLGITHLRGTVVPVIDLRVRLGRRARFDAGTTVAVLDVADTALGVVVDAVSDVVELGDGAVHALPGGDAAANPFIRGVADLPASGAAAMALLIDATSLVAHLGSETSPAHRPGA